MADSNRTEQPTERRRSKAREKGQVARSRELPGALAIAAVLFWFAAQDPEDVIGWKNLLTSLLRLSIRSEIGINSPVYACTLSFAVRWLTVPLFAAWVVGTVSTLAQGGFVFSSENLVFKPERFNPAQKLQQMFSAGGLSNTLKSLIPFGAILWIAVAQLRGEWMDLCRLSDLHTRDSAKFIFSQATTLGWKFSLVLLLWSGVDYLLQRQRVEGELKMSRDEVKEEYKESEGNPQIKAKIRRLQRQVRRAQMLRAVKTATVVVTNPTHYALALEYQPEMAAPVLVAKGLDLFAEEIKQMALWYDVPLVENPPLAHALYRTMEVGQMIPAKLYAAVAEVLAAIYRAQAHVREQKRGSDGN